MKLITNMTGAIGTLLSHDEKQAFVSRNQQENAYNNQIRIIYQDKQHEYHIYYAATNKNLSSIYRRSQS